MALASLGYFANITLVDSGGNKSTMRYDLSSVDLTTAAVDAATLASRLGAITDAVVLSYSVGEKFEEDTTFYAAAGVHVEDVALLSCKIDDPEIKYVSLRVPAPVVGIFQQATGPNSNLVDPTDADLQTYLGSFATTGGIATVSDGETLEDPSVSGNVTGKRIHRGSRKG